ncbi:MAG TPA: methyltransferase [Gaiellaceae bacterium]|nr:methyltransferase [Gaiellaceae bacterium]
MTGKAPQSILWDLLRGALATRGLGIVAELGIAEALADGPRTVTELADTTAADPDTLHRLLRALASDGVFAETEPGVFENTESSNLLRRRSGWADFASLFGGPWHRAAGELATDSGEPAFERAFGVGFWEWLAQNPEARASFDRAMEQGWESRVERLESAGWRGDELVVDVGGGNGSLLVQLIRRHPGLRGIVLDLPETNRDEAELGRSGIEFMPGDFFEAVPRGNAYILSTILHDWDDDRAAAILRTIRAAAPEDARLLLLESIVPAGNEPDGTKWLDLLMLTLFHGRERSEDEWRTLLDAGGFEPIQLNDGLIEARCRSR